MFGIKLVNSGVYAKKVVTPGNDLAVTTWSMLFASVSLLVINCFRLGEITLPQSGAVWSLMIYLAVFPTALGFYAWNAALGRVSLNLVTIQQLSDSDHDNPHGMGPAR